MTLEFTTDDIEYMHHGDRALLLRLVRPKGNGPFPIVVDIHCGAWTNSDRFSCAMRDEAMARAGIAAAALDFRQGPDGYPSSRIDINYAIRWLKVHAAELRLDATRVGLAGASSGAHLAMLCAMRSAMLCAIALLGATNITGTRGPWCRRDMMMSMRVVVLDICAPGTIVISRTVGSLAARKSSAQKGTRCAR